MTWTPKVPNDGIAGASMGYDLNDGFVQCVSEIVKALEDTGDYRVLKRVTPHNEFTQQPPGHPTKVGIILDCETTGLDTRVDEIIELGLVRFEYAIDGRVVRVLETFNAFNEPSKSIPASITEITGINNEMVAGHHIDPARVALFISDAQLIIAHNANFDRKIVERYWPEFQHVAWACSLEQVDWRAHKFEGTRLTHLLGHIGFFHDAHRGLDDCRALLEILAFELPGAKATVLDLLLQEARRTTVRIWAENAPYDLKESLKKRRYRWSDGSDGRPRSWYVDVDEARCGDEIDFLRRHIFQRDDVEFHIQRLDAFVRFSNRI
jgi:DNA polymerase-3 subunit epsilon